MFWVDLSGKHDLTVAGVKMSLQVIHSLQAHYPVCHLRTPRTHARLTSRNVWDLAGCSTWARCRNGVSARFSTRQSMCNSHPHSLNELLRYSPDTRKKLRFNPEMTTLVAAEQLLEEYGGRLKVSRGDHQPHCV